MKIFVNFTNHPWKKWDERQTREALKYGTIQDIPFPSVKPQGSENYIDQLAKVYTKRILEAHPSAVLCQGEFCLCYQVVKNLQKEGILVLAACSERMVKEMGQKKEVSFVFRRFRSY